MTLDESQSAAAPDEQQTPQQRRVARHAKIAALHADWRNRFPAAFTKPVPLAIGIVRQIRQALPPGTGSRDVSRAVHRWTQRPSYLKAVARGEARRNLDGSEAGVPDEAARDYARRTLAEREQRARGATTSAAA